MEIISSNEFDATISSGIVLVDFFANWCGPCKMLSPVLEKVSNDYPNIHFVKLDVDKSGDIAMRYQVQSIPTLLVFKDGNLVERQVGFAGEPQLRNLLNRI